MKTKKLDYLYRNYPISTHKFNNFYYVHMEYRRFVNLLCNNPKDAIQDAALVSIPFLDSLSPEQFIQYCELVRHGHGGKLLYLIERVNAS